MCQAVTRMYQEIAEIPQAVDRLLSTGGADLDAVLEQINSTDFYYLISIARGSSDHVCTYLKYASELLLKVPMVSIGPSISSIYESQLKVDKALCLAVSQSGRSPDIVCLLYTSPSPRDQRGSRMPSSA